MAKNQPWTVEENLVIARAILDNPNYRFSRETVNELAGKFGRTYTSITSQACKLGFTNEQGPENCEEYLNKHAKVNAIADLKQEVDEAIHEQDCSRDCICQAETQKFTVYVETHDIDDAVGIVKFTRKNLERAIASLDAVQADAIGISIKEE